MRNSLIWIFCAICLSTCSSQATLGTKEHLFDRKAAHVVWIKVDGLSPEHFALIDFDNERSGGPLAGFSCLGLMWNYNLFKLRPSASEGFMAQTLGSRNIKRSCSDIDRAPVWSFYQRVGHAVGLFYSQKSSLKDFDYGSCRENKRLTDSAWVWKREKNTDQSPYFHFQEQMMSEDPAVMYDKSCQQKSCEVSFSNHAFNAWKALKSKNSRSFFVVRDSLYKDYIISNKIDDARKRLLEIQSLYEMILKEKSEGSVSVIVSTSGSLKLDLPKQGKPWMKMAKGRGYSGHKSSSLHSYVWSTGPGTENFCGSFNESEMLRRFLWLPEGNFVEDLVY